MVFLMCLMSAIMTEKTVLFSIYLELILWTWWQEVFSIMMQSFIKRFVFGQNRWWVATIAQWIESCILFVFALFPQQINALRFLHMNGYVHRDVIPENIAVGAGSDPSRYDLSFKGCSYLCSRVFEYISTILKS